jgi:hypothetical protein
MQLLELEEGFGEEEVKAAHRRLAKDAHPDTGETSDAEKLPALGEARDLLLGAGGSTALVTREDLAVVLRKQGELVRISQESEATVKRVVVHHVGKLAAARARRLTVSGLGAVIGLLLTGVGALSHTEMFPLLQPALLVVGSLLSIVSLALAAAALLGKEREERLQLEIEEAGETLADKGALVGTLAELGLDGFFTREELQDAIYYWSEMDNEVEVIRFKDRVPLSRVAAKIGPVDFARLLLAKGLESEMIEEAEEPGDDVEVRYGYRRA